MTFHLRSTRRMSGVSCDVRFTPRCVSDLICRHRVHLAESCRSLCRENNGREPTMSPRVLGRRIRKRQCQRVDLIGVMAAR